MKFELKHHFHLESARFLPRLPEGHPCRRMHGHSFKVTLILEGPLDPNLGWIMDFNEVAALAKPVLGPLDHRVLNEVPGLENPTSEILCRYIFETLKPSLSMLRRVTIAETSDSECSYGE